MESPLGLAHAHQRIPARPWVLATLAVVVVLSALRALTALGFELSPDEAYYWVWSHRLAPSYFDHPPAVAIIIAATRGFSGALGPRLAAI